MLDRILEPEVMDSAEEACQYDAMDHREVNQLFVADLLAAARKAGVFPPEDAAARLAASGCWPPLAPAPADSAPDSSPLPAGQAAPDMPPASILDIGTGTAQIPIELCHRWPMCRVMAVDLAVAMLDLARWNIERAGLIERIQLDQADAKQLPYADGMFDAVISNTIVHHIPRPEAMLAEAVRVARPGGMLFIRDLIRPASEAQLQRLVETYAPEANDFQRGMFAASLRAALTVDEIRSLVGSLGYPAETVQPTSDRHWTWSTLRSVD